MSYTLAQSIAWAQSVLTSYIPLTAQAGNEPATTIANMVVAFMLNAPFTWPTNRDENTGTSTTAGVQDYTIGASDFGFLETVTLVDSSQKSYAVKNIYNSLVLGQTSQQEQRPQSACVKLITPGTNFTLRFMGAPDAVYGIVATYQKIPVLFSATSQDWFTQCNIPPNQTHIYNNLFLSECYQVNGDEQAAAIYRRRGMAALLATAEGLTDMQKSMIFGQALFSDLQTLSATMRAQSAGQARTV